MKNKFSILILTFLFISYSHPVYPEKAPQSDILLSEKALEEELRWLQAEAIVFTASRQEQKVSDTAAAIFVITREDIRHSSATSIPELLRMAPGLQVARINSNQWAITSRGFNSWRANKLLVLMDGRSLYHPIFSGTIWHSKDTMLENIERIEVIRGPGAALWGANAVNGIINIITKKAVDTQGSLVSAGGGNEERGFGSTRYGGKMGDNAYYRGYIKYYNRDDFRLSSSGDPNDEWDAFQGGFRTDWDPSNQNSFTFQGDLYNGDAGDFNGGREFYGGNILGRWSRTFSDTSDMALQLYYDRTIDKLDFTGVVLDNEWAGAYVYTYDADFQHRFNLSNRHELTWGLGYRYISDYFHNSIPISFNPNRRNYRKYSTFIQDEITLITDKLKFIVGSKLEHNDYTGYEVQPNGRLIWTPHEHHTLWGAISRAVRTPTRFEDDFGPTIFGTVPGPLTIALEARGDRDYDSEDLLAYELGYRFLPTDKFFIDFTTFYNKYDDLFTAEARSDLVRFDFTGPAPLLVVPVLSDNKMKSETYGVEVSAQWQALSWWRFAGTYSYLQIKTDIAQNSTNVGTTDDIDNGSPHNQATLSSSIDLPGNVELDVFGRYVDELKAFDIDDYVELDFRIGWNPLENLELSIGGSNLLDKGHPEYPGEGLPMTEIERSVFAKITLKF